MPETALMLISMGLSVAAGVRLLRKTGGLSMLAWHALFIIVPYTVATLFARQIIDNYPNYAVFYSEAPLVHMRWSMIAVNFLACVLMLISIRAPRYITNRPAEANPTYTPSKTPALYWVGWLFIVVGIVWQFSSEKGQLVFNYGLDTIGDYGKYYLLRYELSNIGQSVIEQHVYWIANLVMLPIFVLYALHKYIVTQRQSWLIFWLFTNLLWAGVSLLAFQKAPIVNLVLANLLGILLNLQFLNRRPPILRGILASLIAIFVIDAIYRLLGASDDFLFSLNLIYERLAIIPFSTAYNHYVVFPDMHPHTFYNGSRTLNLLLAAGHPTAGGYLPYYRIASSILYGLPYNMNTGLIGAGWAEQGYLGVLEETGIVFGVLFVWDQVLFNRRSHMLFVVLLPYFLGKIWNIQNSAMLLMLTAGGLILAPLLCLLLFKEPLIQRDSEHKDKLRVYLG